MIRPNPFPLRLQAAARAAASLAGLCLAALVTAAPTPDRVDLAVGVAPTVGSALELTVGLTPGGDGSTCGSATEVAVEVGEIVDFCYTATNHSDLTLAYSTLEDSVDGTLFLYRSVPLPPGASTVFHRRVVARASRSHRVTWSALESAPAYTFDDGVTPGFVDIRSSGTRLGALDDTPTATAVVELAMPFAFPLFGRSAAQLCVTNLGVLFFDLPVCNSFGNGNQTLGGLRAKAVAPFWDTLWIPSGGVYWEVQGSAPNRRLIVQWDRAHMVYDWLADITYESALRANLQAILGEDGSIQFQYQSTAFGYVNWITGIAEYDDGRSATIGLRYFGGTGALSATHQYSHNALMPHPAPSAIVWAPTAPTVLSAQVDVAIDAGRPLAEVTPDTIVETAVPGSVEPVSTQLRIGNAGDRPLEWSIRPGQSTPHAATAVSAAPLGRARVADAPTRARLLAELHDAAERGDPVPRRIALPISSETAAAVTGSADCAADAPGMIAHDDGAATNGYAGAQNGDSLIVDRYTPTAYPATFAAACVAFTALSAPAAVDYQIVVYDDSGAGGGPGNELARVDAQGMAVAYPGQAVFGRVDLSGLGLIVEAGSVYIGVSFDPGQHADGNTIYLMADEDGAAEPPPYLPEGGYFALGGQFVPTVGVFSDYVALMVRAVEATPGCLAQEPATWLTVGQAAGSVAVGAAPVDVPLVLDPTGLGAGSHRATLCLDSADIAANGRPVAVPVKFEIRAADTVFADGFDFAD